MKLHVMVLIMIVIVMKIQMMMVSYVILVMIMLTKVGQTLMKGQIMKKNVVFVLIQNRNVKVVIGLSGLIRII